MNPSEIAGQKFANFVVEQLIHDSAPSLVSRPKKLIEQFVQLSSSPHDLTWQSPMYVRARKVTAMRKTVFIDSQFNPALKNPAIAPGQDFYRETEQFWRKTASTDYSGVKTSKYFTTYHRKSQSELVVPAGRVELCGSG